MKLEKAPVAHSDEPFLLALYAATRRSELASVFWSDELKNNFLKSQFQAQQHLYLTKYPEASFQIIKLHDQPVGRLYTADLEEEIRILEFFLLPEFRRRSIGSMLLAEILQTAGEKNKSVQICLETDSQAASLFIRHGFSPAPLNDGDVNRWWRWARDSSENKDGDPEREL